MRRLWVVIDRNGRVIPAMIHPIVPPKDLLETALSFLYLFIRPLVLISLLPSGPRFSLYRRRRVCARDDAAGYTLGTHTHIHRAMRQQEMGAVSPLPFETSFRNAVQHCESVINFVGSRMRGIGIDIGDHRETMISS